LEIGTGATRYAVETERPSQDEMLQVTNADGSTTWRTYNNTNVNFTSMGQMYYEGTPAWSFTGPTNWTQLTQGDSIFIEAYSNDVAETDDELVITGSVASENPVFEVSGSVCLSASATETVELRLTVNGSIPVLGTYVKETISTEPTCISIPISYALLSGVNRFIFPQIKTASGETITIESASIAIKRVE
jgi:hypothetical protein